MKETMYTYIEALHHQLMAGRPVGKDQWERLGELILEEPLNPKAFSRAVSLGEPPESVKGMAGVRLMEQLPRKVGPAACPGNNWLAPAGSPTATDPRHIQGYFHSAVNSLLTDAYRANEKFHGRPDPRTVKKEGIQPTWSDQSDAIPPLEALPDDSPSLESRFCDTQYDDRFQALAALGKDPLHILYFLCRRLDYMPQEQLELFSRRSPGQILNLVEYLLDSIDQLDRRWTRPLRSRLPEQWPASLTAKEISNGISKVSKALSVQGLTGHLAA